MKPLKLHMINIGPYKDETVDFTKLENMFLIKGDTGAGKTFIFDAITFALYGALRGNRKGHESDLKSRYAEESDDSYVEFTFETGGRKYFINRSVPFSYTNRNGKITRKLSSADLQEFKENSSSVISGKLSEVNEKIKEIIGLSADEFAQIVVLPQGEFAEFLHQNTNERVKTLEKLFPVEFYASITKKIKEKADEANENLKGYNKIIESISSSNDFTDADEKIKKYEAEIKSNDELEKSLIEKKQKIAVQIEGLKHEMAAAEEYENNLKKLNNLETKIEEFSLLAEEIVKADKAKGLREFIKLHEASENYLAESKKNLKDSEELLKKVQEDFKAVEKCSQEMNELNKKNEESGKNLKVLQEKLSYAEELSHLKELNKVALEKRNTAESKKNGLMQEIQKAKSDLNGKSVVEILSEITKEVQTNIEKKSSLTTEFNECKKRDEFLQKKTNSEKELKNAKDELQIEEEKSERTEKTIEELKLKQKEDSEKHQAYLISNLLKSGTPCPVCGSVEHPVPAKKPEGLLDYSEQIKTNEENVKSIKKLVEQYKNKIATEKANLSNFERELSNITTKRELCIVEDELNGVEEILKNLEAEKSKINKINDLLKKLEESLEQAKLEYDKENIEFENSKTKIATIEEKLGEPAESIKSRAEKLSATLLENKQVFEKWQNSYNEKNNELSGVESAVKKYQLDVEKYTAQAEQAEIVLKEKILNSDFKTEQEAKAACIEDSVLEKNREKVNKFNEELKSARDAVNSGKIKNLKSMEEISVELNKINEDFQKAELEYSENHKELESKRKFYTEYKNDYNKIQTALDNKLKLEEELKPLNALNEDLSGRNPQKLQFESWALGMYFEQVVEFASKRFSDISDGRFRFELKRADDANFSGNGFRGLDLLVFDSHTCKTSDAAELSGGETFEASISLALAITDVVQNNNGGGIQLDSLFIDEGFGTLDPETLEKAMMVLSELGETKMIGMISHVSEMENFSGIRSAIKVNKSNTGSFIQIEG